MLRIVKVSPSVGKSVIVAVSVLDLQDASLHDKLTKVFVAIHGEYTSIEYLEQFAVPVVSLRDYKIDAFINADELN